MSGSLGRLGFGRYWTVGSFPEVQFIPPEPRRRIIGSLARRTAISIGIRSTAVMIVAAFTSTSCLFSQYGLGHGAAMATGGVLGVLAAVFMWQWVIIRVRMQVRATLVDAARKGQVPVCLGCGHDVSKTPHERCPECGAALRAPAR